MKKIVITLLIYMTFCTATFAQNESDFVFDGKGTITGYKGRETKLVIPSHIGGVPVTAIEEKAFANKGLTSVNIPSGVYVGWDAFANNKLTSLTIPNGVMSIGNYTFARNRLTSVIIPASVTSIGEGAFHENPLTSITLPAGIVPVSIYSFDGNLVEMYTRLGEGTYTRPNSTSETWTKQ
jgi:hypothetical protein